MQDNSKRSMNVNWEVLLGLILVVSLYFMYSSTFLTDYLMNDELTYIGANIDPIRNARIRFFRLGRPLAGFMLPLVYKFVGFDPARAQLVRFISFASFAAIAVILFVSLARRSRNTSFGFLVVLFFFAQVPLVGLMGYSLDLISFDMAPLWLSLAAFYLFFSDSLSRRWSLPLRGIATFVIMLIGMQFHQAFALFCAVPLAYLALTDWTNRKKQILIFLGISALVLMTSTIAYKLGLDYLHERGREAYPVGEAGISALTGSPLQLLLSALNPVTYWTAFKLWSYPFPFNNLPSLRETRQTLATVVMAVWMLLVLAAVVLEWRRSQAGQKWEVVFKWLAVLVCFGFGAAFIVADEPGGIVDHRPHLALTTMGVVIFAGGYCLQVLASHLPFLSSRAARYTALAVVIFACFGAQSGVMRGIVINRASQLTFVRTELARQLPIRKIAVILPTEMGCTAEPCDPWLNRISGSAAHLSMPNGYIYALATIGEEPRIKGLQVFEPGQEIPKGFAVIDWNGYVSQGAGYAAYLAKTKPPR